MLQNGLRVVNEEIQDYDVRPIFKSFGQKVFDLLNRIVVTYASINHLSIDAISCK